MATIEKVHRESGTVYKAKVRKQGHPTVTRSFKTRSAAERWGRKYEAQIDEGNAGLISEAQQHKLADAIKKYRAEFLPKLRSETARKYEQHLDYWEPHLGHLRLSELTAAKIAEHRDLLATTPIPSKAKSADKAGPPRYRSPATINRHLATLGAVLTACVKQWHWLQISPLQQVAKGSENNAGTRYLSEDELQRLLAACRESESPDLLLAVLLSITTGARQGEILKLRWKDIDLQAGVVQVRVDNETSTKGGIRSLPIAAQVLPLLQARKKQRQQGKVTPLNDDGLLFPSRVSDKQPVQLRTPWETALRRAKIEHFRWHDLRHSCASFLARNGASLLEIGNVLGHKSANTTKRYAHLSEQHTHALVRNMADGLLGTAGGEG
ncbi:MAG: site-specific integrase [Chromatiaceae bacterium]|nr:site-specific integrase [Chromatiaceae bacterium]